MTVTERLRARSVELTRLSNIQALLQWDQEVMMPGRAAAERVEQIGLLSGIIHQKYVDPELDELLCEVEKPGTLSGRDQALVRLLRREQQRHTRQPEKFVVAFSRLIAKAVTVWTKARVRSEFDLFFPLLEQLVGMSREKAAYLGYEGEPYNALLDIHEEGLTAAKVETVFNRLQPVLLRLLEGRPRKKDRQFLRGGMPVSLQQQFSTYLLDCIGYDFNRGRQDVSAHPFTTSLGHHDRRLTSRFTPDSLEFIFTALHEGGHALYEQGIDGELAETHLDTGVSLGIHESQSRLWENIIGRSRPFWEKQYPELTRTFPEQFAGIDLDAFLGEINRIQPAAIRVEADEASYNLHILIRFDLERALLAGEIEAGDLPSLWKQRYLDYLDVLVDSDANGVLQDIHWAYGAFGYFPTYTIGNLAAAQIWNAYRRHDPACEQTIRAGDFGRIRAWLHEHIHRHGAVYPPAELLGQATGRDLDSGDYIEYLNSKYASV